MNGTTHPNELLISLQRGDMQSCLSLHIRPVEDIYVAVEVHPGHTKSRAEEILFGRAVREGC